MSNLAAPHLLIKLFHKLEKIIVNTVIWLQFLFPLSIFFIIFFLKILAQLRTILLCSAMNNELAAEVFEGSKNVSEFGVRGDVFFF